MCFSKIAFGTIQKPYSSCQADGMHVRMFACALNAIARDPVPPVQSSSGDKRSRRSAIQTKTKCWSHGHQSSGRSVPVYVSTYTASLRQPGWQMHAVLFSCGCTPSLDSTAHLSAVNSVLLSISCLKHIRSCPNPCIQQYFTAAVPGFRCSN
jgi:hypothetical protein